MYMHELKYELRRVLCTRLYFTMETHLVACRRRQTKLYESLEESLLRTDEWSLFTGILRGLDGVREGAAARE